MLSRELEIEIFQYESLRDAIRVLLKNYKNKVTESDVDNLIKIKARQDNYEVLVKCYSHKLINQIMELNI